jgi:hypothetical protein
LTPGLNNANEQQNGFRQHLKNWLEPTTFFSFGIIQENAETPVAPGMHQKNIHQNGSRAQLWKQSIFLRQKNSPPLKRLFANANLDV